MASSSEIIASSTEVLTSSEVVSSTQPSSSTIALNSGSASSSEILTNSEAVSSTPQPSSTIVSSSFVSSTKVMTTSSSLINTAVSFSSPVTTPTASRLVSRSKTQFHETTSQSEKFSTSNKSPETSHAPTSSVKVSQSPTKVPMLYLDYSIRISLSGFSIATFTESILLNFKIATVESVNSYCSSRTRECSVINLSRERQSLWIPISADNVKIYNITENSNNGIDIIFYVTISDNSVLSADDLYNAVQGGINDGTYRNAGFSGATTTLLENPTDPTSSTTQSLNPGLLAAIVVSVLFILILFPIIILAIIYMRKKCKRNDGYSEVPLRENCMNNDIFSESSENNTIGEDVTLRGLYVQTDENERVQSFNPAFDKDADERKYMYDFVENEEKETTSFY
ncbi:PREDICTED: probable GPI-anchored adhesin-like protein PGA55 [Amphimedon queenslandica]|uniref:Uncharacterized protein n=2 Tax=Amphimedon queenslandica TaxID=400682 RepID=A0AAN0JFM7_AMPQE|nr:PREDICTED: probable GPI-anchored adhesin-like protein PGA55 [Amphimedon queenslandica]|eukprot:XP_019855592.1 PREDICTED: probable GPI-anchored adhesin-like protein PGA55 [Amphimedon queenslandica]